MSQWSVHQENIFSHLENPESGNAIIRAVAGSGKTTTIVEGTKRIPRTLSQVFLAFNKAIADELKSRRVNAKTFHSLTMPATMRARNAVEVSTNKLDILVRENFSANDSFVYGPFIKRLVGLAKQVGIGKLLEDQYEVWMDIVAYHDLEIENERGRFDIGIAHAQELLRLSNESDMIDFDDMLYLPVLLDLALPKFDVVFVDEAQDTNAIQREILRKVMHEKSRLVAVGDPAQAIYGFRGADSNSLSLIAEEFDCITLPLSVTYRCPTSVVKYAQQWVPDIQAAENAPEGIVEHLGKWDHEVFKPHDLVVCRTTRPLITLAFKLLRAGVPASMLGRDIGAGIKALVKKLGAKDIDHMLIRLEEWREREVQKAITEGRVAKSEQIKDRAQTLEFLAENLIEGHRTIDSLLENLDYLFADKQNAVILATAHKSKGLEANRVFWLNRSQCPSKWARQDWQVKQEENICYVITTRAKQELYLIEEPR